MYFFQMDVLSLLRIAVVIIYWMMVKHVIVDQTIILQQCYVMMILVVMEVAVCQQQLQTVGQSLYIRYNSFCVHEFEIVCGCFQTYINFVIVIINDLLCIFSPTEGICCFDNCTFIEEDFICREEEECALSQTCRYPEINNYYII